MRQIKPERERARGHSTQAFLATRNPKFAGSFSTGAGEAIRTPDPNLGKVMLYP